MLLMHLSFPKGIASYWTFGPVTLEYLLDQTNMHITPIKMVMNRIIIPIESWWTFSPVRSKYLLKILVMFTIKVVVLGKTSPFKMI